MNPGRWDVRFARRYVTVPNVIAASMTAGALIVTIVWGALR
jgi:hypothetical protein